MSHDPFLTPPIRLSQAFENDRGGGGVTRRTFIKRTGGATVSTMVAWNLGYQQAKGQGNEGQASSYRMKLDQIDPETGIEWHVKDSVATIDGVARSLRLVIEIVSGPSLGGFPESSTSISVSYSVIASIAIEQNGAFLKVAEVLNEYDGKCNLKSPSGPELESSVWQHMEEEEDPSTLPPLDNQFQFNQNGSFYTLAIALFDCTGRFRGIEMPEDPGDQTFVSAAAKLTGSSIELTTNEITVTHSFISFENQ